MIMGKKKTQLDSLLEEMSLCEEEVKEVIEKENYVLLSEYTDAHGILITQCPKKHIYPVSYSNFKQGKRCPECAGNKRHTGEFVFQEFINHRLIPKFEYDDYKNAKTLLPFICPKHIEKDIQHIHYDNLNHGRGCHYCSIEKRKGKTHWHWNNGKTLLNFHLRESLNDWKLKSLISSNYKCALTNYSGTVHIHHVYSFNKLITEILNKLNLDNKSVGDYSDKELKQIENLCVEYHDNNLGICLHPRIHKLYHSLYKNDNDQVQFNNFKIRIYSGEFDTYLNENKLTLINKIKEVY